MELKTDGVGGQGPARQPGPFDRALAFFDPSLRCAALVVEGHDALGRPRQIGHDEPDARIKLAGVPLDLGHDTAGEVIVAMRADNAGVLVPILYLKGISTGDFEEPLAALLGKDAPGLSASTIARLKEVWIDEHEHWRKRDLSAKHHVYVWAHGIYLQARLEDAKQCILVIIGATPEGRKELFGFTDGARESAQDRVNCCSI